MKPVFEKKLDNGVKIFVSDHSRRIAADRWYIKVVCHCSISINEELYYSIDKDTPEMVDCVRGNLRDKAQLELVRERKFVDESEKDKVVSDIQDKINDIISGYMSLEQFPQKLFASSYNEAKMKCLAESGVVDDHHDDVGGLADFSECFRD